MKNMTISSLLNERLKDDPTKIVIVENDKEVNWGELKRLTDIAATEFINLGISRNTHVGIYSINSLQWVVSYLALCRIGALPVLINYNYKKSELEDVLIYSDIEYLLFGDGFKTISFKAIINEIKLNNDNINIDILDIGKNRLDLWESKNNFEINYSEITNLESQVDTHDNLNLIFTSGTTTCVKGIVLSHYQMLNISRIQSEKLNWDKDDIICLPLPLFHCFGLSCGIFAALNKNVKLCLTSTRSIPILETIQKHKCTVLNGVPSMFCALMNNDKFNQYDISSLNSGIVAGARVDENDFIRISEKCHIPYLQQSYGQTETSPAISFTEYDDSIYKKSKTVGKVISDIEVRIYDNCNNSIVDNKHIGEVQVKGFNVLKNGYYKLKEESKSLYTKDGWLKTGDTGYFDDDQNLYITGRIKEMIIKRGENICPYEIEEVIMNHKDMIQVKVLGIKDKFCGEEIVAVYTSNEEIDEKSLYKFMKTKLADYKIPKYFIKLKDFPLIENGKINTKEIKKIVFSELTGGEADGIKSTTKVN